MTRALCLNSTHCTLELTDEAEVYVCRDAVGLCEEGLLQSDIDACRAIEGCMPDDGECYCGCRGYGRTSFEDGDEAEDCLCACGGGEPPSCQPTPDPVPG
jgi:hypothetical protein